MTGLVTAIYDIGCALGAVFAFMFGEQIGRKKSIILANVIVIIGAAVQTASFEYWQMFVARIIGGVGVGLSTVAIPILQSETLPAHKRGALLVVQSALIIIGVALASWLCFACLYANSSLQWRFPVSCQILFSILVLSLSPWLCESPRWLAQRGRVDEVNVLVAIAIPRSSLSTGQGCYQSSSGQTPRRRPSPRPAPRDPRRHRSREERGGTFVGRSLQQLHQDP
jgi:MFS family permease